ARSAAQRAGQARTPSGSVDALTATAVLSRTLAATPAAKPIPVNGAARPSRSRQRWAGDSIGYIYVYIRGKIDSGEHRRRLIEDRDGAETMLSGAVHDLGACVLREGVQHPDLTSL